MISRISLEFVYELIIFGSNTLDFHSFFLRTSRLEDYRLFLACINFYVSFKYFNSFICLGEPDASYLMEWIIRKDGKPHRCECGHWYF